MKVQQQTMEKMLCKNKSNNYSEENMNEKNTVIFSKKIHDVVLISEEAIVQSWHGKQITYLNFI